MKKIMIAGLLCIMLLSFFGCGEESISSADILENSSSADTVVQGANDTGKLSVGETGIVHIKEGHLLFFDYQSKKDYVICSRSNCRHNDDSCSGWYTGYHGAAGLAEYGGKLYCLLYRPESNVYELVQMDMDGNRRKVIAEIDGGDSLPGKWEADLDLSDIYYSAGQAITCINWNYNPKDKEEESIQTQQCVAVNLKSGEITEITPRKDEEIQCRISAVSTEYSLIEVSGYEEQPLTEAEFYEKYEEGDFEKDSEIMKAENPYEVYMERYFEETPQWYQYLKTDLKEKKTEILKEGVYENLRDESGKAYAIEPPFYVLGWYKGDLITEEFEYGYVEGEDSTSVTGNRIYRWDLKEDKRKQILSIDDGYVFDAGGLDNTGIIEGERLLFYRRTSDDMADYYSFSLDTEKETYLYKAERNVPYRIIGETKDSFIYYTFDDTKKYMYMTKKDDYYSGNFDNSVRLEALDEWF